MTWSWSDVQRSTPAQAQARGSKTRVSIALDTAELAYLDAMADAIECSRAEAARRLLVAVIEDDRAAHDAHGDR